ncbi:hypothetical protein HK405_002537, partial [Cladochytrium tenue]
IPRTDSDPGAAAASAQLPALTKKEKRHREFLERLDRINRDFAERKDRIYHDKLGTYQKEIREIQDGTHPEFRDRLTALEAERNATVARAELFRQYQHDCAHRIFQAEKEAAEAEFN